MTEVKRGRSWRSVGVDNSNMTGLAHNNNHGVNSPRGQCDVRKHYRFICITTPSSRTRRLTTRLPSNAGLMRIRMEAAAVGDRPGAEFVDHLQHPGHRGFEDDLALFGGGRAGVAVDAEI